jgi:hypothetical protein
LVSDGTATDPQFDYSATAFSGSWTFSAVAGSARSVPVAWDSSGFYSYFHVSAGLTRFIQRNGIDILTESLVSTGAVDCCDPPSDGFDYSGTTTFDVQPGDVYGFRVATSRATAA